MARDRKARDAAPPAPWRRRADNVLAFGEATLHHHEAIGEGVAVYGREDDPGVLLMVAPSGAVVTHQEHGPATLPPGRHARRLVQVYDHVEEMARAVVD